jgi:hypothetical protein
MAKEKPQSRSVKTEIVLNDTPERFKGSFTPVQMDTLCTPSVYERIHPLSQLESSALLLSQINCVNSQISIKTNLIMIWHYNCPSAKSGSLQKMRERRIKE